MEVEYHMRRCGATELNYGPAAGAGLRYQVDSGYLRNRRSLAVTFTQSRVTLGFPLAYKELFAYTQIQRCRYGSSSPATCTRTSENGSSWCAWSSKRSHASFWSQA